MRCGGSNARRAGWAGTVADQEYTSIIHTVIEVDMNVLVTGSSGLIGSEAVRFYESRGCTVVGVDNNMRGRFFGLQGDTRWNLERLRQTTSRFTHIHLDIRNGNQLAELFKQHRFDVVVHCAAQPSHDKAREMPTVDFAVNATGTLNLLEATRRHAAEAVFVHFSTNKVYGDAPNELPLIETATRYDYERAVDYHGINESCRIDQSLHSIFGASKAAADIMAQEYAQTYGLKVGIFRGGCLTGPFHSGVELHGFLSYLVHVAVYGLPYRIYGYKGKQVRDQIHSADVLTAVDAFVRNPRPGGVYNLGGGRGNAASIMECIEMIKAAGGYEVQWSYIDENRLGDHICYISDTRKFQSHYPEWSITRSLPSIVEELIDATKARAAVQAAAGNGRCAV
jgi:CDP-paratose 2-epimerase